MKTANTFQQVLISMVVLIFGCLFCGLPIMSLGSSDNASGVIFGILGWAVPIALAAGAFFGLNAYRQHVMNKLTTEATAHLTPHLPGGETLLATVNGFIGPSKAGFAIALGVLGLFLDSMLNGSKRKFYYLGLTEKTLLLVEKGGAATVTARNAVKAFDIKFSLLSEESTLKLDLPTGQKEILIEHDAKGLLQKFEQVWKGS